MEHLAACPSCGGANLSEYLEVPDYSVSGEVFALQQCTHCMLLITNPRPSPSQIGPYYKSEEYISHSNTKKGWLASIYQVVRKFTLGKKRKLIASYVSGKGRLLDYGCGTGEFLNEMKNSGWEVEGMEPDQHASEQAISNYGLQVNPPSHIFTKTTAEFSVITLWHVLEHVHELKKVLKQIHVSLLDDGLAFVAVPNQQSWDAQHYGQQWAAYDVPRHLYHFTPESMGHLLSSCGFTIKKVLPMKFDAYYVALLSEKYKKSKLGPVNAFFQGMISNNKGRADWTRYSSLIYVIEKSIH